MDLRSAIASTGFLMDDGRRRMGPGEASGLG
jgi:hypothetical protein